MQFVWDPTKARTNLRKHGVAFEEASTVFFDDLARINDDHDHSVGEHREIIAGYSAAGADDVVRIINARMVDSGERRDYEERDI